MKYLLSFLILTLLSSFDFYNPKGFNYQAIVRDASGNIKKNANVNVAFDILDQSDNVLYSESHTVTTNDFGVINLVIGEGSTSDDFSIVDWSIDELSIKVTLDGTVMGTSPLLSVPYANYANNGITSEQAAAITSNSEVASINTTSIGAELTRALAAEADLQSQIDGLDETTRQAALVDGDSELILFSTWDSENQRHEISLDRRLFNTLGDYTGFAEGAPSSLFQSVKKIKGFGIIDGDLEYFEDDIYWANYYYRTEITTQQIDTSNYAGNFRYDEVNDFYAVKVKETDFSNITIGILSQVTINSAKVGITSDQAAAIEANTAKVGVYTDDSDNTVAGAYALNNKLGKRNTAIGKDALRGNKDGGDYNTAIGYYSLRTNTTGTGNTALGNYSLQLNTEGKNNTASGKFSLQYNTTGDNNTAMGSGSLNRSTEANNSAALGYNALKSVTTGNANTSVGATAGDAIVTGIQNTVMGYNSGGAVTSGGYNVLIGANAGSQNSGTTKKAIIGGSNNTLVGTGTAVDLAGATNRTVIGKGAIGKVNNSVTLGNSSVTDVYAADDGDATVHAKGITFSDGTTQTTAAVASESKVTFNQVRTTSFTDLENVLEIGDLVIRINEHYLEWKVNSGEYSDYFDAIIIIQGTRAASNWGSLDNQPNYGDANSIRATNTFQEIVDRTDAGYNGGPDGGYDNSPGLWYYKMVEIELFNKSQNESYKITAYGNGSSKVTIKGEYWNFK